MSSFIGTDRREDISRVLLKNGLRLLAKKYTKPIVLVVLLISSFFMLAFIILSFIVGGLVGSLDTNSGFYSGVPTTAASWEIGEYMQIFEMAQEQYGVSWAVLAAICKIESSFGVNMGPSSAGAVGFMQIMPKTWSGSTNPKASNDPDNPRWDTDPATIAHYGGYGLDGDGDGVADPRDPWDSVFAAAKLLSANGFKNNPRKAVFAYNHAWWYVDDVMAQAEEYSQQMLPVVDGVWPLPREYTRITSPFGALRPTGPHHGVDIACPVGTSVFAALPGKVTFAGWKGVYGYCVMLTTGPGQEVLYGHLSQIGVKKGQSVDRNQIIALSGNTGRSTGPHLHFEVRVNGRASDPLQWLNPPSQNY